MPSAFTLIVLMTDYCVGFCLVDSFGYQLCVIQLMGPRWHLVCLSAAALPTLFASLLCALLQKAKRAHCLDDDNIWLL